METTRAQNVNHPSNNDGILFIIFSLDQLFNDVKDDCNSYSSLFWGCTLAEKEFNHICEVLLIWKAIMLLGIANAYTHAAEFGNSAERENVNKTSNFEPKLRGTLGTKGSLGRKKAIFWGFL